MRPRFWSSIDHRIRSWMHQLHDWFGVPFRWFLTRTTPGGWVRTHTTPNFWSIIRIPISVVVGLVLHAGWLGWASLITVLTVLTDRLDGEMARLDQKTSVLGMILDTVADFVFVSAIILALASRFPNWWLPVVLIGLEVIRLTGALVIWTLPNMQNRHRALRPNMSGKYKMAAAIGSVLLVLWGQPVIGQQLVIAAIGFSCWSLGRHLFDLRRRPELRLIEQIDRQDVG